MKTKAGNKKAKKMKPIESVEEPDLLGAALRRSRSKTIKENTSSLEKEDLGKQGLKINEVSSWNVPGGRFNVPITDEEDRRRKDRQLRFTNGQSSRDETLVALSSALSALRKNTKGKKRKAVEIEGALVGTCPNLEKSYLRLTTFPKAEDVRPLDMLTKSLKHIKSRYIQEEDFEWANDQLKSVRQDMTVQGLTNNFSLEVYETHARILLENGDLNEFNQCQTMIRTLTTGLAGIDSLSSLDERLKVNKTRKKSKILSQSDTAADEFGGYRLLYAVVQNSWIDLAREFAQARQLITYEEHNDPARERAARTVGCRHAVFVVKALIHNDYHGFFRLYDSAPHLSAYLMDFLVKRVRTSAYERIISAYRPSISVEHFREALHFKDLEETRYFLRESGAVFVEEKGEPPFWVNCKSSK